MNEDQGSHSGHAQFQDVEQVIFGRDAGLDRAVRAGP